MIRKFSRIMVASVLASLGASPVSAQTLFDTYLDAATKAILEKRFDAAEMFVKASLQEAENPEKKSLQGADPRVVVSLHLLSQIYFDQGKKDKAQDVFRDRKLRIDVRDLGPELLPIASQLNTLAEAYFDQGSDAQRKFRASKEKDDPAAKALKEQADFKFKLAKNVLMICSAIRKKNLDPGNRELASNLVLLGITHNNLEEFNDGSARFEDAVKARKVGTSTSVGLTENGYRYSVSKPSRDISISQEVETLEITLARILTARDLIFNYDEKKDKTRADKANRLLRAERELKQTLDEWMDWPDHENVALCVTNLGLLYSEQERYDDAEAMYQRSLAILEKIKSPNDANIATVRRNYAELLRKRAELSRKAGREAEAEQYENRAKKLSSE